MMTEEQLEAVRAFNDACEDPNSGLSAPYGRLRRALGGWPAVARLLLAQHDEVDRLTRERDDARITPPRVDEALGPDPTHTPAVRRVVAWEAVRGDLTDSRYAAYVEAALSRMTVTGTNAPSRRRLDIRMRAMDSDWEYFGRVRDRLSAYLRHRDESKGYR